MAHKHIKRCSTWHVIRDMQIEITMKYPSIPTGMSRGWNTDTPTCWWGYWSIGSLYNAGWNAKWKAVWLEDSVMSSYKMKHTLIIWFRHLNPCYLPKGIKKKKRHLIFVQNAAQRCLKNLFLIVKTQKLPRCPSGWWMDKRPTVYPGIGVLFSGRNKLTN